MMTSRFRRDFKFINLIVFFSSFAIWCRGQGEDFLAGLRGGLSLNTGINRFQQVEAFGRWELPWHWKIYSECYLLPAADISAGSLWNENGEGFVGTLGPVVEVHFGKFPVMLEGGSSPSLLSRNNFGRINFGDRFQFTSHIGVQWDITKHFSVDWRFQHMSDAGIAEPNPGLNMQMFSANFRF
jgi:lipid A 3-O-deacylase